MWYCPGGEFEFSEAGARKRSSVKEGTGTMFEVIIEAVALLLVILETFRRHRAALWAHPKLAYQPPKERAETWRWQPPEKAELRIENQANTSAVVLPSQPTSAEAIVSAMGYLLLLVVGWGVGAALFRGSIVGAGFAAILGGGFALMFLSVGAQVTRIEVGADRIRIVIRYAFVLRRAVLFRRRSGLRFSGRVQSVLGIAEDQREPRFYLSVKSGLLSRRFILSCNQSQGSWIVGGLQHWVSERGPTFEVGALGS